jgi:sortase A
MAQVTTTDSWFRRGVSGLGRTLITTGVLLLFFVAYQLWGTGIATAQSQNQLRSELEDAGLNFDAVPEELLTGDGSGIVTIPGNFPANDVPLVGEAPTSTVAASTEAPSTVAPSTVAPSTVAPSSIVSSPDLTLPAATIPAVTVPPTTRFGGELVSRSTTKRVKISAGEGIGRIVMKKISVDEVIVSGADQTSLRKGPGHYGRTPLPGEAGNSAIACHRTTFGAPCFRLDEMQKGDAILILSKVSGRWFRYNVTEKFRVKPSQNEVLLKKGDRNTLTLTTCDPQYSAKRRLIVVADLVGEAVESDIEIIERDPLADQLKAQRDSKAGITTTTASTIPASTIPASTVAPVAEGSSSGGGDATTIPESVELDPSVVPEAGLVAEGSETPDELPSEDRPAGEIQSEAPILDGSTERSGRQFQVWFFKGSASAWTTTGMWAGVCAAIWFAAWLLAHRRREMFLRWAIYGTGFVVLFLPALYFCFQNISRLLPEAV